jgi:pimeloyl-ACP methyl ester carboxylesterase
MPSEANRPNWEWVARFDPMPHIAKMTLPVLVLLGEADSMGSTEVAARRWRDGLARAGKARARVLVIRGMGHAATIGPNHQHGGATIPAYFTEVEKFLSALKGP